MSGNNSNNASQNTPQNQSWYRRIQSMVSKAVLGLTGRDVTRTDVASAAIATSDFVLNLVNSAYSSYNTPESKLAISFFLNLVPLIIDQKNYTEKIDELNDLQMNFIDSLDSSLVDGNILLNSKTGITSFAYTDAQDLKNKFKNSTSITIKLKTSKEVTLYNMNAWSENTKPSNRAAVIALGLATINLICIVLNYHYRNSTIATGTLLDNGTSGFNSSITVDTTKPSSILPITGKFTMPGVAGGCIVDDVALHEAHLAALANNSTLMSPTNFVTVQQPPSLTVEFSGDANVTQSWLLSQSWYVNFDYGTSLAGSLPIRSIGDWITTYSLQQQASIREAALSIYGSLKGSLDKANMETVKPEVLDMPKDIIYILEKTSALEESIKGAKDLREKITTHNADVKQLKVDTAIKKLNSTSINKQIAEHALANERQMHASTKQEKKITENKLKSSEQSVLDAQTTIYLNKQAAEHALANERLMHASTKQEKNITENKLKSSEQSALDAQTTISDLQKIYQALVIKSSEIIALQASKTGEHKLVDDVNTYLDQLKSATSTPGMTIDANEILEKIADLIKAIPDIVKQTQLSLASSSDTASLNPSTVSSPNLSQEATGLRKQTSHAMVYNYNKPGSAPLPDMPREDSITPTKIDGGEPKPLARKKSGPLR